SIRRRLDDSTGGEAGEREDADGERRLTTDEGAGILEHFARLTTGEVIGDAVDGATRLFGVACDRRVVAFAKRLAGASERLADVAKLIGGSAHAVHGGRFRLIHGALAIIAR